VTSDKTQAKSEGGRCRGYRPFAINRPAHTPPLRLSVVSGEKMNQFADFIKPLPFFPKARYFLAAQFAVRLAPQVAEKPVAAVILRSGRARFFASLRMTAKDSG